MHPVQGQPDIRLCSSNAVALDRRKTGTAVTARSGVTRRASPGCHRRAIAGTGSCFWVAPVMMLSPGRVVKVPFLFGTDHAGVTSTDTTLVGHHPADSAAAERLWDALYLARAGKTGQSVADLEDAAYRLYLPMARTLAHTVGGITTETDRVRAEQTAELGLAHAVLAWRQRTSGGFRRFARSTIMRQLQTR